MKKTILLFSALLIFGNLSAQDKAALVNPIIGTNVSGGLRAFRTGPVEPGHGHDPS